LLTRVEHTIPTQGRVDGYWQSIWAGIDSDDDPSVTRAALGSPRAAVAAPTLAELRIYLATGLAGRDGHNEQNGSMTMRWHAKHLD
jgi:hypothetical protein